MKKQTKKKNILALLGLLVIGIVAAGTASAFGWGKGLGNKEEVDQALDDNDYEGWKTAMSAGLTEERFAMMQERHQERMQMRENREETLAAIEASDYDAWLDSLEDCPFADELMENINEDNFDRFVEMHNLRQDGDFQGAQALAEELGLDHMGPKGMRGQGKGMGRGQGRGRAMGMHGAEMD